MGVCQAHGQVVRRAGRPRAIKPELHGRRSPDDVAIPCQQAGGLGVSLGRAVPLCAYAAGLTLLNWASIVHLQAGWASRWGTLRSSLWWCWTRRRRCTGLPRRRCVRVCVCTAGALCGAQPRRVFLVRACRRPKPRTLSAECTWQQLTCADPAWATPFRGQSSVLAQPGVRLSVTHAIWEEALTHRCFLDTRRSPWTQTSQAPSAAQRPPTCPPLR